MTTPTVINHPTLPAPARASLTPKGRLTVQLIKLEAAIDGLTDAEQLGLAEALTPLVRVACSRVASRQSTTGRVA